MLFELVNRRGGVDWLLHKVFGWWDQSSGEPTEDMPATYVPMEVPSDPASISSVRYVMATAGHSGAQHSVPRNYSCCIAGRIVWGQGRG